MLVVYVILAPCRVWWGKPKHFFIISNCDQESNSVVNLQTRCCDTDASSTHSSWLANALGRLQSHPSDRHNSASDKLLCLTEIKLGWAGKSEFTLGFLSCVATLLLGAIRLSLAKRATFSSPANLLCLIICFPITSLSLLAEICQLWLCEPALGSVTRGNVWCSKHFHTH